MRPSFGSFVYCLVLFIGYPDAFDFIPSNVISRCIGGHPTPAQTCDGLKKEQCLAVQNNGCIWDPYDKDSDGKNDMTLESLIKSGVVKSIVYNEAVSKANADAEVSSTKEEQRVKALMEKMVQDKVKTIPHQHIQLVKPNSDNKEKMKPNDKYFKTQTEDNYAANLVTTTIGPEGVVYDIRWVEDYLNHHDQPVSQNQVLRRRLPFAPMGAADDAHGIWMIHDPDVFAFANAVVINSIQTAMNRYDIVVATTAHDVFSTGLAPNRFWSKAGIRFFPGYNLAGMPFPFPANMAHRPYRMYKSAAFPPLVPGAEEDIAVAIFRNYGANLPKKQPATRTTVPAVPGPHAPRPHAAGQISTIIGYGFVGGNFQQHRSDDPNLYCHALWCIQDNLNIPDGYCGSPYFHQGQTTQFYAIQSVAAPGGTPAGATLINRQRLNWMAALARLTVFAAGGEYHARAHHVDYGQNLWMYGGEHHAIHARARAHHVDYGRDLWKYGEEETDDTQRKQNSYSYVHDVHDTNNMDYYQATAMDNTLIMITLVMCLGLLCILGVMCWGWCVATSFIGGYWLATKEDENAEKDEIIVDVPSLV